MRCVPCHAGQLGTRMVRRHPGAGARGVRHSRAGGKRGVLAREHWDMGFGPSVPLRPAGSAKPKFPSENRSSRSHITPISQDLDWSSTVNTRTGSKARCCKGVGWEAVMSKTTDRDGRRTRA